ncbi:hypothetical protein F511_15792 [Dorcoceras hygrometricum]|uniref:Uncharacterized protein n=1 Tax=Dorcoceras hygrometricum TaxID=472368 RepID=A0A2Z7B8P1_9LAMI|nr:hypothetical protein F511_15792 [Dorcoceras hygrometricum]
MRAGHAWRPRDCRCPAHWLRNWMGQQARRCAPFLVHGDLQCRAWMRDRRQDDGRMVAAQDVAQWSSCVAAVRLDWRGDAAARFGGAAAGRWCSGRGLQCRAWMRDRRQDDGRMVAAQDVAQWSSCVAAVRLDWRGDAAARFGGAAAVR